MARKGSTGAPENRTEEDSWEPSGPDERPERSLDKAVEVEIEEDDFEFIYGDIVHDEEKDDPEELVVVNTPDLTAEEWEYEDDTLADRNPTCPPHDDVVICIEKEILDDYLPDWDMRDEDLSLDQLRDDEVPILVFPSCRLILDAESHLRD
jgi:hypothetical protein